MVLDGATVLGIGVLWLTTVSLIAPIYRKLGVLEGKFTGIEERLERLEDRI